jgi:uncharacterized membrane protein
MRITAQLVMGALAGLLYVWASHWLMTAAPPSSWNAVALLAPMLMLIVWMAWGARQRVVALVGLAVLAALGLNAALGQGVPQRWLFVGQHVVIHLALAALFGISLRRGSEALISSVARHVHGHLTPAMARYSRKVTIAWVLYFIGMAAMSVALFLFAPFDAWATFANWLTPLAVALMFGGEHLLRYRLHPEFERVRMVQVIAAYARRSTPPNAQAPNHSGLAKP